MLSIVKRACYLRWMTCCSLIHSLHSVQSSVLLQYLSTLDAEKLLTVGESLTGDDKDSSPGNTQSSPSSSSLPSNNLTLKGKKIIELGAGTGLASIAATMHSPACLITTDLPEHTALLCENVKRNQDLYHRYNYDEAGPIVAPLAWGIYRNRRLSFNTFRTPSYIHPLC